MLDRIEERKSSLDLETQGNSNENEEKEISLDVAPSTAPIIEDSTFGSSEPIVMKNEAQIDEFDDIEYSNEAEFESLENLSTNPSKDNFNDFEDFSDDGFGEDFVNAGNNDDDFGDFDNFEETNDFADDFEVQVNNSKEGFEKAQPSTPSEADIYVDVLEKNPEEMPKFIEGFFNRLWSNPFSNEDKSDSFTDKNYDPKNILNTACSFDLWDRLSRDTVFHNPVTGAVGSFQWTRSEANKAYLNALGVTITTDEKKFSLTRTQSPHLAKKRQTINSDGKSLSTSPTPSPLSTSPTQIHVRSVSATGGLIAVPSGTEEDKSEVKEADQELELDIDIARAYCELTEETIRIFPDVKLHAMVTELTRLQKQAGEYLEHLLDQREQLMMDAETYNDLISCIVGQAQRLREQNPSKDSSPAMVSKKKKSGNSSFSNIMRRKTTSHNTQSVSMGGGVVGVQHPTPSPNYPPKKTTSSAVESRRSL